MNAEILELKVKIKEYEKKALKSERLYKKELLNLKNTPEDLKEIIMMDINIYKNEILKYKEMSNRMKTIVSKIEEYNFKKSASKSLKKIVGNMKALDMNAINDIEKELDDLEVAVRASESFTYEPVSIEKDSREQELERIARGQFK